MGAARILACSRAGFPATGTRRLVAMLVALALCGSAAPAARAEIPSDALLRRLSKPPEDRPVLDLAQILSAADRDRIEQRCLELRQKQGAAIVVVILKSLEGGQIDDFTVRLFAQWKPGDEKRDDGVMLLVALQDRKARIEVGNGLEPVLTDALAGRVLDQQLFPAFKQQRYGDGIFAAVDRIAGIIERGEPAAVAEKKAADSPIVLILWLALVVGFGALTVGFSLGSPHARDRNPFWFGLALVIIPAGIGCLLALLPTLAIHGTAAVLGGAFGYAAGRKKPWNDSGPPFGGPGSPWGNWAGQNWGGGFGNWGSGGSSSGWSGGGFSGSWGGFGGGSSGGGGASGSW